MTKKIKIPTVTDLEMNNKAEVISFGGWKFLKSYEVIVVAVAPNKTAYALYDITTNTTWRHYNAFAHQYLGDDYCGPKGYAKLAKGEGIEL